MYFKNGIAQQILVNNKIVYINDLTSYQGNIYACSKKWTFNFTTW